MRWVLALLAGCSFDPRPALPAGDGGTDAPGDGVACTGVPDFDGDGRRDDCDLCPHLSSDDDPDGDGDGVGDACDPQPTVGSDARAIWIAFYAPSDIDGWMQSRGDGVWSVTAGELVQNSPTSAFSLLDSPAPYTDAYFATSVEVVTASPAEIGFCLADDQDPPGSQYYCCGVSAVNTARAVSIWPTGAGERNDTNAWTGNHAADQQIDITGTLLGAKFSCEFAQGAERTTRATAAGDKIGTAVFYTAGQARYRYLFLATLGS
ncbi:MAG TPA: hypothetical protein VIU61_14645 [Kofleriaceae bacterium]